MIENYEQMLSNLKKDYILFDALPEKVKKYLTFDCPIGFGDVTGKLGTHVVKVAYGNPDLAVSILKNFIKQYSEKRKTDATT